jgi:hypothetical protein
MKILQNRKNLRRCGSLIEVSAGYIIFTDIIAKRTVRSIHASLIAEGRKLLKSIFIPGDHPEKMT